MVNSESEVLPTNILGVDDDVSGAVDVESLLNNVAESRPRPTEEWADIDQYNDVPEDS